MCVSLDGSLDHAKETEPSLSNPSGREQSYKCPDSSPSFPMNPCQGSHWPQWEAREWGAHSGCSYLSVWWSRARWRRMGVDLEEQIKICSTRGLINMSPTFFLFVLFGISFGRSLYIFSTAAYKIDDLKVSFSYGV